MKTQRSTSFVLFLVFLLLAGIPRQASAVTTGVCDVNGDGIIDRTDIALITAALNRPASGPGDPRDVDLDLKITVLDARKCTLRCAFPLCAPNVAPVANAGPDQFAPVGAYVTLDGSGSSDANPGDLLSYAWSWTGRPPGSAASLSDPGAVRPGFIIDRSGVYTAQLMVVDRAGRTSFDTVQVTTLNTAPVANAGPDQTAYVTNTVTLSGAGSSDLDGNPLSYSWSFVTRPPGSAAILANPATVTPSFLVDRPGNYQVQLVVNDGTLNSVPDSIIVSTLNSKPVAQPGANQTALVTQTVHLDGSGSTDVDGDPLSFHWSFASLPPGSLAAFSNPNSAHPDFVVDRFGSYTVQLVVNDGYVNSDPASVTISTLNSQPVAYPGPNQTVAVGALVQLDGAGSTDVDGNPLTYSWSITSRPPESTASLSSATQVNPTFTADKFGSYLLQLIVNDGTVDSAPATVTISTQNSPPVANAGPDQTVPLGSLVNLDGSGSTDVDGNPLSFLWSITSKPSESAATLSDPTSAQPGFLADKAGSYTAQLIVNDGTVNSVPSTVQITTVNSRPVANAGPNQEVTAGALVQLDGSASSDADGDPLSYRWSLLSKPDGSAAVLSDPTLVAPSFSAELAGTYVAQLIVNDGKVDSAPTTVTVTVTSIPNRPPVAADDGYTTLEDTTLLAPSVLGNDLDADGDPLSAVLVGLPSHGSVTLNPDGSFSYLPQADFFGTDSFTYQASDGKANSNTATVSIAVLAVNDAPTLDPVSDLTINAGAGVQTVNLSGIGSGAANEVQSLAVVASSDNTSLIPNPTIGYTSPGDSGSLSFTPLPGQTGSALITVAVRDDGGTANAGIDTVSRSFRVTVQGTPDLTITKTHTGTFYLGQTGAAYTITVSNIGLAATNGLVAVLDTLPAGLSASALAGTDWNCSLASLNCTRSDPLAPGGSYPPITLTATVAGTAPPSVTNSATVAGGGELNLSNNTAYDPTTIEGAADLGVTLTASSLTPSVGQEITFTVTVANSGPSNSTGVQVTDLLPTGYGYLSHTQSQGSYNAGTGLWNLGTVNSGASKTLTITAMVLASGVYANTATRTASAPRDPNAANDQATVTPVPFTQADVLVTKTASNLTPSVGQNVIFTLTVTNIGPANATGVQVVDLLPTGYSYLSSSQSQGSYNTSTGLWNIGTVNSGASDTLNITATVLASGVYANTATRTASTPTDPNAANDSATVTPVPELGADLAVSQTASSLTPSVGQTVTFTVTVTNNGPANATGVQVVDHLPSGYGNVGNSQSQGSYNADTGLWNIGTVNSGASKTLNLTATVLATGVYANTATRTASTPIDPNAANDQATVTPVPIAQADVSVSKTASNLNPSVGQNVIFTLTVTNIGPANATGVQVSDLLPTGYSYVTHTMSQGSYNTSTGLWSVGTINSGASDTLNITATVLASGVYANTATRTASIPSDPNPANDQATVTPEPEFGADLAVSMTVTNLTPSVGQNVTFTVTLTNLGPANATGVQVIDLLPSGYSYVTHTMSGGGAYNTGTGLWNIGTVNSGDSKTLNITATVNATGVYANTATRTASTPADSNAANDSATVTPVPYTAADVSVSKTVSSLTPSIGQNVIFTMTVTNIGPANATGVQVVDLLPSGYSYVTHTMSGGGSYSTGTGVWNVGTIASGDSKTLNVTATVLASGVYANTATRTASTPTDPNAANDSATVSPVPFATADLAVSKTVTNLTPSVGQNVTFSVTVTNDGPANATGVQVVDLLPSGYSYVTHTMSGGGSYATSTGVWSIGTINSGDSKSLNITATVNPTGVYANTATRTASTPLDPNGANDSATVTPVPYTTADISVSTTASNTTPSVGQNVTFTVTVTNSGPANATGVQVVDLLPGGYSYVTHTLSQGSYNTGTGLWNIGTIDSGDSKTLHITATVLASGIYANTATRTASTPTDPNAANDQATATPVPYTTADLSVSTTASNTTPSVGQNVTFTITVTNSGPANATGVQVVDLLPGGYSYVTHTLSQGSYNTGTGLWNIGTVNSGDSKSLHLTATVNPTGDYANTATRTASTPTDPNAANDSATVVPVPYTQADIAVAMSVNNATPAVGQNVTFTVTVTNTGPANATGLQVTDLLPSGYSFAGRTLSQGNYSDTTGVWNIGTVNSGNSVTLNLIATVNATGSYANTAIRSASTPTDPNAANDSATRSVAPM